MGQIEVIETLKKQYPNWISGRGLSVLNGVSLTSISTVMKKLRRQASTNIEWKIVFEKTKNSTRTTMVYRYKK